MIGRYFQREDRQTNVKTEIVAGLTTFLTMAYIIFVNPAILAATGMDKEALIAVTCIVTAATTIIVGLVANAPISMAPGLGLNNFFAYLVVSGKMDWQRYFMLDENPDSGNLIPIETVYQAFKKRIEEESKPKCSHSYTLCDYSGRNPEIHSYQSEFCPDCGKRLA